MIIVYNKKNLALLVSLLNLGYVAITEKGYAVKEKERSSDDVLIVNLIADIEERM